MLTKHQDAAAWLTVGQLDGTEALGGEVGVAAPRGDAVEVEWKGDARPFHRDGFRQLRTAGQRLESPFRRGTLAYRVGGARTVTTLTNRGT